MYKRFFTPPKSSYFLFGPRGTGKSTWLKNYYKKAFFIDLNNPKTLRFFLSAPEKLYSIIKEANNKTIIIDEIQKAADLLNVVHSLIEEKKGYQFIMTGSSSRKLKRKGVNLLAGRALLKHMPPFFAKELGKNFSLKKNIFLGMLPIVLDSKEPKEVLNAYVGLYLKEEVQSEGIIRNVGDFARFLEIISFSQGSIINASNIAREAQIARKTVDSYLSILNDLLLSFHLEVFSKKAKRKLFNHPKFYFFDSGVFNSLRPQNFYDKKNEIDGLALEGLVAQHLKSWIDMQIDSYKLNFWRTQTKIEVDFILYGPNCLLALEVKNASILHPKDFTGLKIFKEDYKEAKTILLYRGKHIYKEKGILCYPVDLFLLKIDPKTFFWESL